MYQYCLCFSCYEKPDCLTLVLMQLVKGSYTCGQLIPGDIGTNNNPICPIGHSADK